MNCKNCGKEIPETLNYCPTCKIQEIKVNSEQTKEPTFIDEEVIVNDEIAETTTLMNEKIDEEIKKGNSKGLISGLIIGLIIGFILIFLIISLIWPSIRSSDIARKPIIYLYPVNETAISITLGYPQNLTHTYPKYNSGWNVIADPSGKLTDKETGRTYYALYWEGIIKAKLDMSEGFVVKGKDTITFLEEKLSILGLNEREANEFIVYWLPELEKNPYNFIRFQTSDEINENMPLNISPMPDSIIRVIMEYKKIDNYIEVKQQQLYTPQREGFTVVEWGGISH